VSGNNKVPEDTKGPCILIYGSVVDGHVFVGPFATHEMALRYTEQEPACDWWIAPLDVPADDGEENEEG
jgi:hypothetical protein